MAVLNSSQGLEGVAHFFYFKCAETEILLPICLAFFQFLQLAKRNSSGFCVCSSVARQVPHFPVPDQRTAHFRLRVLSTPRIQWVVFLFCFVFPFPFFPPIFTRPIVIHQLRADLLIRLPYWKPLGDRSCATEFPGTEPGI